MGLELIKGPWFMWPHEYDSDCDYCCYWYIKLMQKTTLGITVLTGEWSAVLTVMFCHFCHLTWTAKPIITRAVTQLLLWPWEIVMFLRKVSTIGNNKEESICFHVGQTLLEDNMSCHSHGSRTKLKINRCCYGNITPCCYVVNHSLLLARFNLPCICFFV